MQLYQKKKHGDVKVHFIYVAKLDGAGLTYGHGL